MTFKHFSLILISATLGLWLLADSLSTLLTGSFISIGSQTNLWSDLLLNLGIAPYSFAPGLLALGILWLTSLWLVVVKQDGWHGFYGLTAVLTLWYLPVGTLLSMIALVLILSGMLPRHFQRKKIMIIGFFASIIVLLILLQVLNI